MELYDCAVCGEETVVEQPPCIDGHTEDGADCPEWVCTGCGVALLVGELAPVADIRRNQMA